MPASLEEYELAIKDNVSFIWRCSPLEFIEENRKLVWLKVKNLDTEKEIIIPCTIVLTAIGSKPLIKDDTIDLNEWGYIKIIDEPFGMTNIDGVFAGGDVDTMRDARRIAYSIKNYILLNKKI